MCAAPCLTSYEILKRIARSAARKVGANAKLKKGARRRASRSIAPMLLLSSNFKGNEHIRFGDAPTGLGDALTRGRLMRIKIFSSDWSNHPDGDLESEINAFLAEMPTESVKYVQTTNLVSPGTGRGGTNLVITIWYDTVASVSIDEEARQSLTEDMSAELDSAAGFDAPERFPKIRS